MESEPEKEFVVTPNTKVGLVVGLFFIIGIGMLLSHQVQTGGTSPGREMSQLVPPKVEPPVTRAATPAVPADRAVARLAGVRDSAAPAGLTDSMRRIPATPATPAAPAAGTDVAAAAPVAPVVLPAGWSSYKVQAGDRLTTISQKYYKTTKKFNAIYEANKDQLTSPDMVRVGMDLRIPPMSGGAAAPVAAGSPAVAMAPAAPAPVVMPIAPVAPPTSPVLVPPPGAPMPTPAAPSAGTVAVPPMVSVPPTIASAPPTSPALFPPPASGSGSARPANPLDSPALVPVDPSRVPMITIPAGPGGSGGTTAMYRTKEGDTLSSIAGDLMGDSGQWKTLYEANKNVIADPDNLPVGVVLKVPQPRMALGQ